MGIENLIERIVREILTELGETKKTNKILFLEEDQKATKLQFKNLIDNWTDIEFLDFEKTQDISEYRSILIKDLSIDEFLNISEGKQINQKTTIMREAFLKNKEVLIVLEGIEHRKFKDTSNENFYNIFIEKEKMLKSFGVEFVTSSDLNKKLQSIREIELFNIEKVIASENKKDVKCYKIEEKLVTISILKDIVAKTNTDEIEISKDTIITSLAKDYIRENNLQVSIES